MSQAINCFVRGCKAGLVYALVMLLYTQVITRGVTQIHDLDFGFLQNLVPFVLVGLCFGGLLGIADAYINVDRRRVPAWMLACAIWGVFALPTLLLTLVEPGRFEFDGWQHIQGLALAVFLGWVYSGLKGLDERQQGRVTT